MAERNSCNVREQVARHEAQIGMIIEKLNSIEKKLDEISYKLATEVLLEKRIEELQNEIQGLKGDLDRVYSLYRWIIGMVATSFAGLLAVIVEASHLFHP